MKAHFRFWGTTALVIWIAISLTIAPWYLWPAGDALAQGSTVPITPSGPPTKTPVPTRPPATATPVPTQPLPTAVVAPTQAPSTATVPATGGPSASPPVPSRSPDTATPVPSGPADTPTAALRTATPGPATVQPSQEPVPSPSVASPGGATPPAIASMTLDFSAFPLRVGVLATTRDGAAVEVTGARITIRTDASGKQVLVLPVALPAGQSLGSFQHPQAGISWVATPEGSAIVIPFTHGGVSGAIRVRLGTLLGDGRQAEAAILGANLEVGPVPVPSASRQGGEVALAATLLNLPASLAIEIRDASPAAFASRFHAAAGEVEMRLADVAYVIVVAGDLGSEAASGAVEMYVDRGWLGSGSSGLVRIIRIDARGATQVLVPTATDGRRGRIAFRADSPDGFSSFGLVALQSIPPGPSSDENRTPWIGIIALVGALVVLVAGAYFLSTAVRKPGNTG